MRGTAVVVVLCGLLALSGSAFAQGSGGDWQYFNVFNLVEGGYGDQIPSNYLTNFTSVFSYTPARGKFWSTYERNPLVWETGVYGLVGVDSVNMLDEIMIQPRTDRAVLRLDLLASSQMIYIAAIKLTIWGSADFDPNVDLAPLNPTDARALFGVTSVEEDYYTGVQFYVDRDDGIPDHAPYSDIFDSTDVMAHPEKLITSAVSYDVEFTTPYDPTTATIHWTFDPTDPSDPTLKWIKVGTETTPLGTFKKWQAIFPFENPIAVPPQASWSGRNLPFKRIWVVLRSNGCHGCDASTPGVEGISVLDTFYVGIESINDFYCYMSDAYQHVSVPPEGCVEVVPDTTPPSDPLRQRWYRAEYLVGQDTIPPYIYALYPNNAVGSNGPHSDCVNIDGADPTYGDILTEHEWCSYPSKPEVNDLYIYTADSIQLISFIAKDRQTCLDSAWVEIRYLNGGTFPCRIDTVFFRNPMTLSYDTANGGNGAGWEVYIKGDGNDPLCIEEHITPSWGTYNEAGVVINVDGCGSDSFWIAVGYDGPGAGDDYLDPFLDGALVQVTVRVFNRNDHFYPFEYATYAETSWVFVVDLSGPTASLVCPTAEGHDNETREFRNYSPYDDNYNRFDTIEGSSVPFIWLADSLPMFHIHVTDNYADVHDASTHGPTLTGAYGGSGFNVRDFEITFYIHRAGVATEAGCTETGVDVLTVTQDDMQPFLYCGDYVQGVYYDESDDGTEGELYVSFENLYHSSRPDANLFRLNSGDKVYIVFTRFFDDPDFGQGSQKANPYDYGSVDLQVSSDGSWCGAGGNDPNYGTSDYERDHTPVMQDPVSAGCPGYSDYHPDTLGIVRIDLVGPYAPDTLYYPPHGWVTSDTFQVITCDIFDQVGVPCVDDPANYDDPVGTFGPLYYGVSGVHADSIIMNIKVRGCDGSWHPEYGGPEGRNFVIHTGGTPSTHPASIPNLVVEKIRMHNGSTEWWGTRVVFDPYYDPTPGGLRELRFRPGDEVCVTVYACDNAYLNCCDGCAGFGPCPHSEGGCEVVGTYADGVQKFSFTHYVPGMNWAEDRLDPDGLVLEPRQVARWTFYVDATPPQFVVSDFTQCPFGWNFTLKDVSDRIGPTWCDEWVADMAAVDVRIITIDDEDCDGDSIPNADTIFINDLPVGGSTVVYHDDDHLNTYFTAYYGHDMDSCYWAPCCGDAERWGRYLHVSLVDDPEDPERQAILSLYWGDSTTQNCHFFEPGDTVIVEIYAGDAVQVPWFPATERQQNWMGPYLGGSGPSDYFSWHHEDDCYTAAGYLDPDDAAAYSGYTSWRCTSHFYAEAGATLDYDSNGLSAESHNYCDYENPNWQPVHAETIYIQRDVEVTKVDWFNDGAYEDWLSSTQFSYPPDLHGQYTQMSDVLEFRNVVPENVVDSDTANAILTRGLLSTYTTDYYLDRWAKELNFITFEIQSCTDSIIWECRTDTLLENYAPYVKVVLFDSTGAQIWSYEDWYDCDCEHCWLHYMPLRDGVPYGHHGCVDGGILTIGPLDQLVAVDTVYDSTFSVDTATGDRTFEYATAREVWGWPFVRGVNYSEVWNAAGDTVTLVAEPVYGYLNRDSLVVIVRIATRGPNQFGIDTLADYHFYAWSYTIDMAPPTARFASLVSVSGYEEVNCIERNPTNYAVRVRLESISDAGVGCSGGGTDVDWATQWPLPAVVEGSDSLHYMFHPELNQSLDLVYNPGTYWLYTNEALTIHNCADEAVIARAMELAAPITIYHGVDPDVPTVFETDITVDTLLIADSLWAEAVVQDRLGNAAPVQSTPMGLDNGPPRVKGIAFCTAVRETVDWEYTYDTTGAVVDSTPVLGSIVDFNCWDPSLFRLPWEIPDQDSLIGVFNFSPPDEPGAVCTVYVRIWFTDNMDMREVDPSTGAIVRFQPEGWTHWFPVMPIEAHAGFYPLAQYYADYERVAGGPMWRVVASDAGDVDEFEPPTTSDIEPGWNSDREWIGYMVIAGDELMDGVARLRIQGFDDNAGNTMVDHEYPFRIETRYHAPSIGWPVAEGGDDTENDPWEEPYGGGQWTITGYTDDTSSCWAPFEDVPWCNAVTGFDFDPTITDSIVFVVWYHDSAWTPADVPPATDFGDYHYVIDNMSSPDIWFNPTDSMWYAQIPCDSFDLTDLPTPDGVSYVTIEMRDYSRFYPDEYVSDTLLNVWINNADLHSYTVVFDATGDVPAGDDTLVFQPTTSSITIVLSGSDAQYVDYLMFILVDQITGVEDTISGGFLRVTNVPGGPDPWYDPATNTITWVWDCSGRLYPGFYYIRFVAFDEIRVASGITSPAGYNVAFHTTCVSRFNILVPREAFLARGDDLDDALMRTSYNYPSQPWADDIYPWTDEDKYPDYPGWVEIDTPIVEGHEYLDRFQITTFTNPDYTSGDTDPLRHPFTEQGGYPGDSIYVLFEIFPDDTVLDYAVMVIEDEYGGDISGSNLRVVDTFYYPDDTLCLVDCLGDTHCYFVYNWVVDDQDNRYDGPVQIRFTTYEHAAGSPGVTYATSHPTYILLDTYDPEYSVELRRGDGSPMRTCVNDSLPGETIWVTNADTVDILITWLQTVFDQAPDAEDYTTYDPWVAGRTWDYLRLTIDGMPHHGYHTDDPNDVLEARLWHDVLAADDVTTPFWHQPSGGYDSYAMADEYFKDATYRYRWTVAADPAGNGLAKILVKGRDVAGNILDYEEAEKSRSFGKYVLIDTDPPTIDGALVVATEASFGASAGAVYDNLLGGGYYDPATGTYVDVTVYDPADSTTVVAGPYPVNDDGSVDEQAADLSAYDTVLVCATDLAGNQDCALVPVTAPELCCTWDLCAGWNLVALSVVPESLSIESVFGTMPVYINRGGSFVPATDPINVGDGFLVLASTDTTIEVCGAPLSADEFVVYNLEPSWNTIGAPWGGVDVGDLVTDPADLLNESEVYYYDCLIPDYVPTTTLEQCRGHLVWVDGTVDSLYVSAGKVVHSLRKRFATPLWSAKLEVAGSDVHRTLVVGVAQNGTDGFDNGADATAIPAMPGQKDIYLAGHLAADYRAAADEISWRLVAHDAFTLTPDLSGVADEYELYLVAKDGSRIALADIDRVSLPAGEYEVVAAKRAIPKEFALGQNFPNPFNSATVITYQLPKRCDVRIEVFDLSGHKVRTLVCEEQSAGYKSVVWDGTDDSGTPVASGVYLYRIKAGSFSDTKRLLLSK